MEHFNRYRYGLASLLVRRPYLRPYANTAHWWADVVEDYALAIRARDRCLVEEDDDRVPEFDEICCALEDEMEGYMTSGRAVAKPIGI